MGKELNIQHLVDQTNVKKRITSILSLKKVGSTRLNVLNLKNARSTRWNVLKFKNIEHPPGVFVVFLFCMASEYY